jgi:hypothetical protein
MFEQDSRYYHLEDLTYEDAHGNKIICKSRRLIPQPDEVASVVSTTVAEGQRLDQISYATLGKASLYWKIGDANLQFSLNELEAPFTRLRLPVNGKTRG